MKPNFYMEGDTLILLDDRGNEIDAYALSSLQDPREVAAWLTELRREAPPCLDPPIGVNLHTRSDAVARRL